MAAAADRLAGDVPERVSPELVLVDAALAEEVRRRLEVSDDTLARVSIRVEVEVDDEETEAGSNACGGEPLPVPATALEVAHHDAGIEDLILIPEDDLPSVPPTQLVVPDEGDTRLVPEPEEVVASPVSELDDLIVVSEEDRAQPHGTSRSFPPLPSPSSDADEEDATDAVLRVIRDHIEYETPPKRRRRFLSFGS